VVINHVRKKTLPPDMKLRAIFTRIHKELEAFHTLVPFHVLRHNNANVDFQANQAIQDEMGTLMCKRTGHTTTYSLILCMVPLLDPFEGSIWDPNPTPFLWIVFGLAPQPPPCQHLSLALPCGLLLSSTLSSWVLTCRCPSRFFSPPLSWHICFVPLPRSRTCTFISSQTLSFLLGWFAPGRMDPVLHFFSHCVTPSL
jgi:hypothetical protein